MQTTNNARGSGRGEEEEARKRLQIVAQEKLNALGQDMAKKCAHPATLPPPCPSSTDNGRLFKPVCSSCNVLPYFYRFMLNWQGAGYAAAATWPAFSCHACHYYVRLGIVALVTVVAAWDWAWLWQALIRFDCLQLGQAHRKVDRERKRCKS